MGMAISFFVYQVVVWAVIVYKLRRAPTDKELWDYPNKLLYNVYNFDI